MKGISKKLIDQVLDSGNFYDTRRFRYVVKDENFFGAWRRTVIRRISRKDLGTSKAWDSNEWQEVWSTPWT